MLDLLGPTVEFLMSPTENEAGYCVLKGTLPPGVSVFLHSHQDPESFYLLSGSVEVLAQREDDCEWLTVHVGQFIHIPGHAKHAFRNRVSEPAVQLIVTTPRLGRFFEEVGRPVRPGVTLPPPTPAELRHFAEGAARYGHWLGSAAENAAVGLTQPG